MYIGVGEALVILGIVPFWMAVCYFIALVGGWKTLAKHYHRELYGEVTWKYWRSATLGFANYRGCLNFGAGREYLYIQPMLMFRFAHPMVAIPWRDIAVTEKKLFFLRVSVLSFAKCPNLRLQISASLSDALFAKSLVS